MIEYTAAYWATINPVLPLGEFGLDTTNGVLKLGNGQSKWLDLALQSAGDPKVSPLTNQTYAGEFNLSTNYEVLYNEYTTNFEETPTISTNPLIDATASVIFNAGSSASLVTTNMGSAWPGSDTFTAGKQNFIQVFQLKPDSVNTTGLWYNIKVLN